MSEILRRYFWTAYDHLGGVVAYNLLWSLLSLPWIGAAYMLLRFGFSLGGLFLPGAVVLAGALLLGSPATVLLFIVSAYWARGDELNLRELLLTGRRFFWRAAALGGSLIVATGLILVNIFFYQQLAGWLGALLSGLMIWLLLLAGIMALYLFPVLVTQEGSVGATLGQSQIVSRFVAGRDFFSWCRSGFGVGFVLRRDDGLGPFDDHGFPCAFAQIYR